MSQEMSLSKSLKDEQEWTRWGVGGWGGVAVKSIPGRVTVQ